MPSVDVIRNITIRGKADGVDDATAALNRLTASIAAANDNLAKSGAAASSGGDGFTVAGLSAANAANHLRQAAEAAYAFSPAFRGVVNEMAAPALSAAGTALTAIAAGIVMATNATGTGLIKLGTAVETSIPAFAVLGGSMKTAGAALEAFSPSLGGVATSILTKVLPALSLLGKAFLIYDAIKLVAQAWELGGEKLAEYVALSEKAAASGLTTDFFQRISKAATDAKLPVETLTAALQKLNDATAGKLGGNAAQLAIDPLKDAGNFKGNSGTAQLKTANSTEEALRAVVSLYDQAVAKGERLAALDVVRATLGDDIAKKAALDSGYMDKILVAADAISQDKLIAAADIANAVELQNRLDAAEQILSQRWHPIQDILTNLGIKMREAWVGIVEAVATAFDWIAKLVDKINFLPPAFWTFIGRAGSAAGNALGPVGALIGGAADLGISAVSGSQSDQQQRIDAARSGALMTDARSRLAAGLNRTTDTSHPIPKPDTGSDASAYDTASSSIQKYIEVTKAASLSVSDAAGEQEKFKAIAQLTAAGIKDGLTPAAAALKAEMSGLGDKAGAAADALAKAKQVSANDFGRKTAFLSADDVAIATQLKGIYGNDIPAALNSTYAAGIRVNTAFKEISSAIETNLTSGLTDIATGAKKAGQAFSDMGLAIVKALEQMIIKMLIVEPIMKSLQTLLGGSSLFGGSAAAGTPGSSFFGPVAPSALGNIFSGGNIIPFANGGVIGGPTLAPMALMGEAGPEAIVPLKRGPDGSLGISSHGGGGGVSFGDIHINVPEGTSPSDAAAIARSVRATMTQVAQEQIMLANRQRGTLNRAA